MLVLHARRALSLLAQPLFEALPDDSNLLVPSQMSERPIASLDALRTDVVAVSHVPPPDFAPGPSAQGQLTASHRTLQRVSQGPPGA